MLKDFTKLYVCDRCKCTKCNCKTRIHIEIVFHNSSPKTAILCYLKYLMYCI